MNIRHLKTFVSVVDAGSFSKAGTELLTTANALAQQVNCLERDLGISLLKRDYRGAQPTEAGLVFYDYAKQIISLAEVGTQRAREAESGKKLVRFGTYRNVDAVLLQRLLSDFSVVEPDVDVSFVGGDYRDFLGMLASGSLDVIIRPWGSELNRPDLGFQKIGTTGLSVCMAIDHPLARHGVLNVSDLGNYNVIVGCGCDSRCLDGVKEQWFRAGNPGFHPVMVNNEDEVWNRVLTQGYLFVNMGYVSNYLGMCISVPLDLPETFDYGFVYRVPQDRATRTFLDYAAQHTSRILNA